MTEERLKEIKDSINTPVWIFTQRTFAKSYMEIHLQQELELYNEVVRLRDNNEMAISLCNEYLYHDDVCGNEKNINYEELKNVLTRNNLTLEQLTGVENE